MSIKKLSTKQWVAVGAGLVIITIYFLNGSFISSFLRAPISGAPTDAALENQARQPISGLSVQDIKVGTGSKVVLSNSTLSAHYLGYFPNGQKFDSSYDRGVPISFALGQGKLIPGFEKGLVGMKVGGKRRLVISPELAYGAAGVAGVIPPNSTIIFEVELLEVK